MFKYSCKNFSEQNLGLPHTQGTQGNSGNFQVDENLRKFGLIFLTQGSFDFFKKVQGNFKILKISKYFFAIFRMRFN